MVLSPPLSKQLAKRLGNNLVPVSRSLKCNYFFLFEIQTQRLREPHNSRDPLLSGWWALLFIIDNCPCACFAVATNNCLEVKGIWSVWLSCFPFSFSLKSLERFRGLNSFPLIKGNPSLLLPREQGTREIKFRLPGDLALSCHLKC